MMNDEIGKSPVKGIAHIDVDVDIPVQSIGGILASIQRLPDLGIQIDAVIQTLYLRRCWRSGDFTGLGKSPLPIIHYTMCPFEQDSSSRCQLSIFI